jgi:hypothetical protein
MAYQVKVFLEGSNPLIWRRILIRPNINFLDLHLIIQGTMGWDNSHMFAFFHPENPRSRISLIYEDDYFDEGVTDANEVQVGQELSEHKSSMLYEYDFGDSWLHHIELERITDDKILPKGICIDGENACPPEDSGGIPGYYTMVEGINNPQPGQENQWLEWMGMAPGEKWDISLFDVDTANSNVQSYLNDPYYF